ncbi:hypothetical protein MCELHM10_03375 [Paracoccaceae bacterium]
MGDRSREDKGVRGGSACAAKKVQWTFFSPERPSTLARAGREAAVRFALGKSDGTGAGAYLALAQMRLVYFMVTGLDRERPFER